MTEQQESEVAHLSESRSYKDILVQEYSKYVYLVLAALSGLATLITGSVVLHIYVTEVTFVAQANAGSGGIEANPNWAYVLNFVIMTFLTVSAYWEYRRCE